MNRSELTKKLYDNVESGKANVVSLEEQFGYKSGDVVKVKKVDRSDKRRPFLIMHKEKEVESWIYTDKIKVVAVVPEGTLTKYSDMNLIELSEELKNISMLVSEMESELSLTVLLESALNDEIKDVRDEVAKIFSIGKVFFSNDFQVSEVIAGENVTREQFKLVSEGKAKIKMVTARWSNDSGDILESCDVDEVFDNDDNDEVIKIRDKSDRMMEWIRNSDYQLLVKAGILDKLEKPEKDLDSLFNEYKEKYDKLPETSKKVEDLKKSIEALKTEQQAVSELGINYFTV